jgi:ornithine cyclodeaminase/alanine dehydrogenase-like protein (mu-crystallin family)
MRVHDAASTRKALPFAALVPALRTLFAAGCEVPPRHTHEWVSGGGEGVVSLLMPAWIPDRYYGIKVINIASGNAARGLPALHASYLLHDAVTGMPLALIDGDELTARRTAAASALAASWLARADARHLLVVGAGRIAAVLPEAHRAVRPIERVSVWARNADAAQHLAGNLRADGFAAAAVDDLAAAVAAADIVSCATLATSPLIRGRWLAAGSHLDLVGSFTPAMREADDDCFAGAAVFVDSGEALVKSGDLIEPMRSSAWGAGHLRGTLSALARGEVRGRQRDDERTVFKSVGTALADLAAAMLVHEAG